MAGSVAVLLVALAAADAPLLVYEKTIAGNMDIYVQPVAGGVERRLTDDPAEDALPRFAPDGRTVAFSSKRSGEWQPYAVDVQGGPARRLRTNAFREWQADVSPDGRWLAFLSNRDGPDGIWIAPMQGGAPRLLAKHGERTILGNPNFSPDGGRVVFSSNYARPGHHIYVVDVATGKERRISPLTSGSCEPRFSRDGRKVAYVRRRHVTRERSQIVEQSLDDDSERVLVDWPALNYDPVYSPDSSELAFVSTIAGEFAVYRLRLSDGKSWRMTNGPGVARHPDYSR